MAVRGAEQIRYSLDDVFRACDLGIRSFLIADLGLIQIINQLRDQGDLPSNLIVKSSAILAPRQSGFMQASRGDWFGHHKCINGSFHCPAQRIRQAIKVPLDVYIEAPDGLGGYVRHFETPDMIEFSAPIYVKLGLRNSTDIYPYGKQHETLALNLTQERVRRSKLVYDLIQREMPHAIMSKVGIHHEDLGVPVL